MSISKAKEFYHILYSYATQFFLKIRLFPKVSFPIYRPSFMRQFPLSRLLSCANVSHTSASFKPTAKKSMAAIVILSEIDPGMSVFPSSKHLVSLASCCPRNDQSHGKVKSTRISSTGCYLAQLANALINSKSTLNSIWLYPVPAKSSEAILRTALHLASPCQTGNHWICPTTPYSFKFSLIIHIVHFLSL